MAFPTLDYNLSDRNDVPSALPGSGIQAVVNTFSITTAMLATGIVTGLFRMPANTRYFEAALEATDMDTGGSPALAFDLGIAGITDTSEDDVDAFLDASDIGQAGTLSTTTLGAGRHLLVKQEHYVTLTAATAAATAAAGTLQMSMMVLLGDKERTGD